MVTQITELTGFNRDLCQSSFVVLNDKSVPKNADMNTFKYIICSTLILVTIISFSLLISACSMTYSGEKLFFKEGCSQCHTYKGKGGRMGPDLSAVTNLKTDSWIDNYMQNPKSIYPFTRMPSFKHLSSSKRKAIISYLKN